MKKVLYVTVIYTTHNGFKLDLASEYGISRSQLAWIIASNNDYMIIKERTMGHKEK